MTLPLVWCLSQICFCVRTVLQVDHVEVFVLVVLALEAGGRGKELLLFPYRIYTAGVPESKKLGMWKSLSEPLSLEYDLHASSQLRKKIV